MKKNEINPDHIPASLKNRAQWLVWRFEPGEKKPKKMPYYASGQRRVGKQGDDADRAALVTFDVAYAAACDAGKNFSGVGFAFLPGDGLIGIDIDGCIDLETGEISPRAAAIIEACASYTEYSPSGKGVHIIVEGTSETFKSNDIGLEVFCGRQFFTFTAHLFPGSHGEVRPIASDVLNRLRVTVKGAKAKSVSAPSSPPLTDERSKLESALAVISANCGYDDWIHIGMAVYAALGESGFAVWDYWSSKGDKYPGSKALMSHWKSFDGSGGITEATIYRRAIDQGWRPPADSSRRRFPPPAPAISGGKLDASDAPLPPIEDWANAKVEAMASRPSLEILLEHFALIYGTTDVWDGLNRQRIKKAGFITTVGRDVAHAWMTHEKRRTIDPDALPVLRRGRAIDGGGGGDRLLEVLERLTLLYGTVTVWDEAKRSVMTLDAVRAAYGPELVKRWQEHPLRQMKDAENLVFDPTQRVDLATHINMFHGFPLVPKKDDAKVRPILELLFDLCSSEENQDECVDWLLKWLAFPLQHPGAKMQTAVLMFGEKQGTGKSLFFEGVMRPIYGEYGATAGQHQLDSTFTDWKSRKTYVVFEEVLSRDDRYSHMGTLKHMITGRDMRINPKGLPERVEANHLNTVFLSNEPQPIPIELEDRRFMVIQAMKRLSPEFLEEIKQLMKDGVSEAFYQFLLTYPLGNFDEHTKPLMTEAKRKIIRFGRPGWDAFHEAWKSEELSAPYQSCLSEDLYRVYLRWCDRNHEKKLTLTKFSELMGTRETKVRKRVAIGSRPKAMLTVFLIGVDDSKLDDECNDFRSKADIVGVAA